MNQSIIKQVYFDAGLTLLLPAISPSVTYVELAKKHGVSLNPDILKDQFRNVFKDQCSILYKEKKGRFTDEIGHEIWKKIVSILFQKSGNAILTEDCFEEIYTFYTQPEAWNIAPGAIKLVKALQKNQIQAGILSNWDGRLRKLIQALGWEDVFNPIIISSEVGWEKPHPKIYEQAIEQTGLNPKEILMIGDNYENDYEVPKLKGMQAIPYSPEEQPEPPQKNMLQILDWFNFAVSSSLD